MKIPRKGTIRYKGISPFWNSRFQALHNRLSKKNAEMFRQMPLEKKKQVVERMVAKGLLR